MKKSPKMFYLNGLMAIMVLLLLSSCTQDDLLPDNENGQSPTNFDPYAGGVQLQNPYDVNNMKDALQIIKDKIEAGTYILFDYTPDQRNPYGFDDFEISTSHKYVKFTPQSETEFAILKRDSTLVLADYPLDYIFTESYFESRTVPFEDYMPEYFATIAVDKTIPNVTHEVLGDLYLPEQDLYFEEEGQFLTRETVIGNKEDLLHHLLC